MLVLGRKVGESIVAPQCRLTITVSTVHGKTVRLAISAPPEMDVYREEVWRRACLQTPGAVSQSGDRPDPLPGA